MRLSRYAFTILLVAAMAAGCARIGYTVAPGADPVVVHAEQTASRSLAVIDEFLAWEHENRTWVPRSATALADNIRRQYPEAFYRLRTATAAYKAARRVGESPPADPVDAAVARVGELARLAREALTAAAPR